MEILLQQIELEQKEILIMGDFNINLLNVTDSGHFNDLIAEHGLDFLNKTIPTRESGNSATLIDHHISCCVDKYTSHISSVDCSDHHLTAAVHFKINKSLNSQKPHNIGTKGNTAKISFRVILKILTGTNFET